MGRKKITDKNRLEILPLGAGQFRLFGYVNGKRVRKQSPDLIKLQGIKTELEHGALKALIALNDRHVLPPSWITPAQLRDAEAALQALNGSTLTLVQCVTVGLATLGTGVPVKSKTALDDYLAFQKEQGFSERTQCANKGVLSALLRFAQCETLGEFDARILERFTYRSGLAASTRIQQSAQAKAFFTFCVRRKLLRASPFDVDMAELKKQAIRAQARPRILSPDQCAALLQAAIEIEGGNHVPYVILQLWCGIRRQEVERLTVADIRFGKDETVVTIDGTASKTASYRRVTVPSCIASLLKQCADRGILGSEKIGAANQYEWARIREKAGLIKTYYKQYRKDCGSRLIITNSVWQPNILRHTGVSYLYQQTGDIQETARQAGHSTDMAFKHYVNLAQDGDADRFYRITGTLTEPAPALSVA